VIDNVKKVAVLPTGTSKRDTHAVILSSPCMTAIGSAVIPAAMAAVHSRVMSVGAANAPSAGPSLIGDRG